MVLLPRLMRAAIAACTERPQGQPSKHECGNLTCRRPFPFLSLHYPQASQRVVLLIPRTWCHLCVGRAPRAALHLTLPPCQQSRTQCCSQLPCECGLYQPRHARIRMLRRMPDPRLLRPMQQIIRGGLLQCLHLVQLYGGRTYRFNLLRCREDSPTLPSQTLATFPGHTLCCTGVASSRGMRLHLA